MANTRPFDRAVLVYNPNSTGDAAKSARELSEDLAERLPGLPVVLKPTEYAGHAILIARDEAAEGRPLIVSISGDGGYNEVVNGVMQVPQNNAVCAVMAAGNANDHRRATREKPLIDAIAEAELRSIDLLRITLGEGDETETHYAHSYIGFGLTPIVAVDLEKGGKGSFKEIVSVVRTFSKFEPFEILQSDGTRKRFDSLVLANIHEMAKFAKLSEADEPNDGQFEVITLPHVGKFRIFLMAIRAATKGLGPQPSTREYSFRSIRPMPFQLDGEVKSIDADIAVRIESAPRVLPTVG